MTTKAEGQLIALDEARARLAKVATIDEAKGIRDRAEALRHYAKQQGLGLEAQNKAAEIKIRAERRAGEILSEVERTPPAAAGKAGGHAKAGTAQHGPSQKTYEQTIKDADIPRVTAQRWQAEASIPEPIFEAFVATAKDANAELTSTAVVKLAETVAEKPARERVAAIKAEPPVVWAKHMRLLSQVVASFRAIASHITDAKRGLLCQALDRCIRELTALREELQ